jgi:SNF2 family DNA or RNA helicase
MQALLNNQIAKIEKFITMKVGADFGEPGTGKTRSTIELVKATEATLCVFVAPFGAINPPDGMHGIKDEVEKWGGFGIETIFIAPETIASSDRQYLQLFRKMSEAWCTAMIVDESSKIKNREAKRTRRITDLGNMATYKYILNGTPIARCLQDIKPQMDFLSPLILNMSDAEFKSTYCEYITIKKRFGQRWRTREFITKYHNIDHLYSIIEPYVFDCQLNLGIDKQYITLNYEVGEEEKEEYQRLKTKYLDNETLQWKNNNIFLELTQKMQHGYCCTEDKFTVLTEFLKTVDRTKVLLYRKFVESETELKKRFPDLPVFSIQSHSQSLNLQAYDTIIKWDHTWDFLLIDQLFPRVARTGQTSSVCRMVSLTGNVNLEGLMAENNEKKGGMLEYFKQKGFKTLIEKL